MNKNVGLSVFSIYRLIAVGKLHIFKITLNDQSSFTKIVQIYWEKTSNCNLNEEKACGNISIFPDGNATDPNFHY